MEEWLEACHDLLLCIYKKLDKDPKPALADLGLINTRDLCLMLGISTKTAALYRKTGELRFIKKFGRYYYLLEDVRKMMLDAFGRK